MQSLSSMDHAANLPVILLMGPTAIGKTALAIELVQHLPCDIISVDSTLIYRGMDIGTGKPTPEELKQAPHRLINICDPDEIYSAAAFCDAALAHIREIHQRGRVPLLVGGTMMYYRSLIYGLSDLPKTAPAVRQQLTEALHRQGAPALHASLSAVDPTAAARIHPNDPQRILRALEVYEQTGESLTALCAKREKSQFPYRVISTALLPQDRSVLHVRIAKRFHQMLAVGLEEEVSNLAQKLGSNLDLPALRAVGYRQVCQYLLGQYDRDTMIEKSIAATRQLAKRQMTWLRNWDNLLCFESSDIAEYLPSIQKSLERVVN